MGESLSRGGSARPRISCSGCQKGSGGRWECPRRSRAVPFCRTMMAASRPPTTASPAPATVALLPRGAPWRIDRYPRYLWTASAAPPRQKGRAASGGAGGVSPSRTHGAVAPKAAPMSFAEPRSPPSLPAAHWSRAVCPRHVPHEHSLAPYLGTVWFVAASIVEERSSSSTTRRLGAPPASDHHSTAQRSPNTGANVAAQEQCEVSATRRRHVSIEQHTRSRECLRILMIS